MQTSWEYYWCFNREWNRRLDKKRCNQSYHQDEGNCYQDCIKSKLRLIYQNRRLKAKCYFVDYLEGFFCRLDSCYGQFKHFRQKNLEKCGRCNYACVICLFILLVTSVQLWQIFPPKDFEKNTVLKNTHAPIFFFTYCVYTLFSIFSIKVILLFSCVRTVSTKKVVNTQ